MADSHGARDRWLALALVVGCGGGRSHSPEDDARSFAEAICSAAQECECAPGVWSDEPCEDRHADLFLAAIDRGAHVEREAFDDFLAELERDPCLASAVR